jgi:hypothetical protein
MDQAVFAGLRWLDIATILAIIVGPILAVVIDRVQQRWTGKRSRRLEIFRDLMRTRRARLDAVHVNALNLVDLEFYGRRKVMAAYRDYVANLSLPLPRPEDLDRFLQHRDDLLIALLHVMGRELGYRYDKQDLARLSYGPSAWFNDLNTQRENMALLNEVLRGLRALPITAMQPPGNNPYPPAPTGSGPTPGA